MWNEKQSLISAYHNYLVNDMLTPGFVLGDPQLKEGFYFVADLLLPDETLPFISARFYDAQGCFLLQMTKNRLEANPVSGTLQRTANGFRLLYASSELLFSVATQAYTNGYLTMIQAKLYDTAGQVRLEPSFEGIKIYDPTEPALREPFHARN